MQLLIWHGFNWDGFLSCPSKSSAAEFMQKKKKRAQFKHFFHFLLESSFKCPFHVTTERPGLKKTLKIIYFQPSCSGQHTFAASLILWKSWLLHWSPWIVCWLLTLSISIRKHPESEVFLWFVFIVSICLRTGLLSV